MWMEALIGVRTRAEQKKVPHSGQLCREILYCQSVGTGPAREESQQHFYCTLCYNPHHVIFYLLARTGLSGSLSRSKLMTSRAERGPLNWVKTGRKRDWLRIRPDEGLGVVTYLVTPSTSISVVGPEELGDTYHRREIQHHTLDPTQNARTYEHTHSHLHT